MKAFPRAAAAKTATAGFGAGCSRSSLLSPSSAIAQRILRPHALAFTASAWPAARQARSSPSQQHPSLGSVRGLRTDEKSDAARRRTGPCPFAFAFDIDGVLLHVAKPIPGATETLRYLQDHDIPFILLTNGGGKHERDRVADLQQRLGVPLSTANFVQSHTPFRELVDGGPALRDKNVLVTGSDAARARAIAEAYGFRNVVIPADILAAHPGVFPFDPLLDSVYRDTARPLPGSCSSSSSAGSEPPPLKIDAVFVFNDPRDWALDTQLIVDLLLSSQGRLGTYSAKNGRAAAAGETEAGGGWQNDGQPALYFSNPDLLWAAHYPLPRLGQGAFQAALAGVWREITGGRAELRRTTIGKPHRATYEFAERALRGFRAELLVKQQQRHKKMMMSEGEGQAEEGQEGGLKTVYMVGDNPASDIAGANGYASPHGTRWQGVLVRTGVYSAERGEPAHTPATIQQDVREAVRWALRREGWL
ncbi:HAD-like domain-containing protein [Xylariomycetidae sp. FL0641]|nr:HAD-like domain-containing protein [Xylariomycetidae sp. FL0641]